MLELCLRDDQPFYRSLLPAFHDQFSAPYFRDNLKELHETKRQIKNEKQLFNKPESEHQDIFETYCYREIIILPWARLIAVKTAD